MAGYKHRCCAKTVKGTRCKLSNVFTGEFCHIHAPNESEPVAETEAEEEEYNPCSKRFSHQSEADPDNSQEWEDEQEFFAYKAREFDSNSDYDSESSYSDYNPCSKKYSPKKISEYYSETELFELVVPSPSKFSELGRPITTSVVSVSD